MKFYRSILLFITILSSEELVAQNYFYVHGNFSTQQKKEICSQVAYCADLFEMQDVTLAVFKSELPRNLNATIEYQPNQQANRKMILIRLSKELEEKNYLLTISHEMIHAYQYYTGDLIRYNRTNFIWRGIIYKSIHKMEHAKRPWEIEAINQSGALVNSYLDFQKNLNILSKTQTLEFSAH